MTMEIIANNQKETENFAKNLAAKLNGGDIVLLYGELGAGKTTLVKSLAKALGVKNEITSPTFSLMNVYPVGQRSLVDGRPRRGPFGIEMTKLVHIDTYRLKNEQELIDIGAEDYLGKSNTICVIEWPEKIAGLLENKKTMAITIEHVDENKRKIITD
jgi:tRNA threonylcarbamoyladenosine biosynthesis protein TsaE